MLLYAWDVAAEPAIVRATGDAHWRVREMAAKVIARRLVGDGLEAVVGLRDDLVQRVRAAAERALVALTAAGPESRASPTATIATEHASNAPAVVRGHSMVAVSLRS